MQTTNHTRGPFLTGSEPPSGLPTNADEVGRKANKPAIVATAPAMIVKKLERQMLDVMTCHAMLQAHEGGFLAVSPPGNYFKASMHL